MENISPSNRLWNIDVDHPYIDMEIDFNSGQDKYPLHFLWIMRSGLNMGYISSMTLQITEITIIS